MTGEDGVGKVGGGEVERFSWKWGIKVVFMGMGIESYWGGKVFRSYIEERLTEEKGVDKVLKLVLLMWLEDRVKCIYVLFGWWCDV